MAALLPLLCSWTAAEADTYKCIQGGKTVFSDIPCVAGANRVDQGADQVSREQRRQTEVVNHKNARQLSELEYNAARNRGYQGGAMVVPTDPAPSSRTGRYR